jgi:dTDP-4-dehydrorhamnose 3,5-epimerase-like enzyme
MVKESLLKTFTNYNNMPKIIKLPKIEDPRGNLTFIEEENHIPFEIKRVYWIYDVPGGQLRGGHAFKEQQEFIVALSGSFDVVADDGKIKQTFSLNRSYYGLYIPKGLWREMNNFSTNSLAMVLSSTFYKEDDYIREYKDYQTWLKK